MKANNDMFPQIHSGTIEQLHISNWKFGQLAFNFPAIKSVVLKSCTLTEWDISTWMTFINGKDGFEMMMGDCTLTGTFVMRYLSVPHIKEFLKENGIT